MPSSLYLVFRQSSGSNGHGDSCVAMCLKCECSLFWFVEVNFFSTSSSKSAKDGHPIHSSFSPSILSALPIQNDASVGSFQEESSCSPVLHLSLFFPLMGEEILCCFSLPKGPKQTLEQPSLDTQLQTNKTKKAQTCPGLVLADLVANASLRLRATFRHRHIYGGTFKV